MAGKGKQHITTAERKCLRHVSDYYLRYEIKGRTGYVDKIEVVGGCLERGHQGRNEVTTTKRQHFILNYKCQ